MEKKNARFNWPFIVLFTLSMVNLMVMHFLQQREGLLELGLIRTSWVNCLISCLFDVTVLYALSFVLCLFRRAPALALTFGLTCVISFVNVVYARFFGTYLPLTALTEARNLTDGSIWGEVSIAFRAVDLYYPLAIACFVLLYRRLSKMVQSGAVSLAVLWVFYLLLMVPAYYNYGGHSNRTLAQTLREDMMPNKAYRQIHPNQYTFNTGLVRGSWIDSVVSLMPKELSRGEREAIAQAIDPALHGTGLRTAPPQVQNVIVILVESYISAVSDLTIDNVEVTPFLNSLRHTEGIYYNGNVKVNITHGESSDGQLLYMTGLFPLRNEITVSRILGKTLPGMPQALGYAPGRARIIVPTNPTLWQQDRLSRAYGFGHLYSRYDVPQDWNPGWSLSDGHVFAMARLQDQAAGAEPFFSLVLTMTMHSPFVEIPDYIQGPDFSAARELYSREFSIYLACCHYMDACMKEYFDYLKESGLYGKSLIVIASDHDAHDDMLGLPGRISSDLPLYIINGGIRAASTPGEGVPAWDGPCNQVDVYSTILDIMGSDSQWRGLGCSLLLDPWHDYAQDDRMWAVSGDMIYANYFKGAGY